MKEICVVIFTLAAAVLLAYGVGLTVVQVLGDGKLDTADCVNAALSLMLLVVMLRPKATPRNVEPKPEV